jgi:hypothetical protein
VTSVTDRSAAWLARLYPAQWRRDFPDFVEVLTEELPGRPLRVVADVVVSSTVERFRSAGMLPTRPADRSRAGLAVVAAALLPFAALSMGMWSQLHTGLAAQGPGAPASLKWTVAILAVAMAVGLATASAGVVAFALRCLWSRPSLPRAAAPNSSTVRPAVAFCVSIGALSLTGWLADRSGWYSPAAAGLPHHGAAQLPTLWIRGIVATITPAWVHPTVFGQMPPGDLLATLAAPIATLVATASLVRLVRRLPAAPSRRVEEGFAIGAVGTMTLAVGACTRWLLTHPGRQGALPRLANHDPLAPGHTGWLVVMALAMLTALAAIGLRWVLERGSPWSATDG